MNPLMAGNPYAQYQQAQFETASPERLLIMLYDGAIRFANSARLALEEGKHARVHSELIRVQDILTELMATLNMVDGGEIARNLFDLYEFLNRQVVLANVQKNPVLIEETVSILKDLREAWAEAAKNVAVMKQASA